MLHELGVWQGFLEVPTRLGREKGGVSRVNHCALSFLSSFSSFTCLCFCLLFQNHIFKPRLSYAPYPGSTAIVWPFSPPQPPISALGFPAASSEGGLPSQPSDFWESTLAGVENRVSQLLCFASGRAPVGLYLLPWLP